MALTQVGYARGAHMVQTSDVELPPWSDRRSTQFGLSHPAPDSPPATEPAPPQARSSTPALRGTAAELRRRYGHEVPPPPRTWAEEGNRTKPIEDAKANLRALHEKQLPKQLPERPASAPMADR